MRPRRPSAVLREGLFHGRLLREFLTETNESLDVVDVELVRFEQDPNNAKILDNIFRLVHTIKGTCGFLGLPRLRSAGARRRNADGQVPRRRAGHRRGGHAHPRRPSTASRRCSTSSNSTSASRTGDDSDLIDALERMVAADAPARAGRATTPSARSCRRCWSAPLRPGEVSLDELERAFRETPGPASVAARRPQPPSRSRARKRSPTTRTTSDRQQGRQPVDPRQCRHARTPDDHGVGAGAHAQPAARHRAPARRIPNSRCRCSGCPTSPPSCRKACMKTRMQPIGNAWQKLPRIVRDLVGRTRQDDRARDARRRHRARPPGARPDQGPADPHGAQFRRSRPGDAGASGIAAGKPEKRHDPAVRLSRRRPHHHRASPTTAAASTPSGSRPRRSPAGSRPRPSSRRCPRRRSRSSSSRPASRPPTKVTSVSGRGVGMDVVRANIDQIGGTHRRAIGAAARARASPSRFR